jgi:methionine--tRNA ligase beta chain
MKPGDLVKTNKGEGCIKWIDHPWFDKDGEPADLLVKVTIDKAEHWFRLSELEPAPEKPIEKTQKETTMKPQIEFQEFMEIQAKLEIKVGLVTQVEEVPKSAKLLKLTVDFADGDVRTVVTNIKPHVKELNSLIMRKFLFITNLKPVTMMGIESTAMIVPGEIEKDKTVTVYGPEGTIML